MIKINIGEHTLFVTNDVCSFNLDSIRKKRVVTYRYTKPSQLIEILLNIPKFDIKNHILYHSNIDEVLAEIFKIYSKIEAAGGLVINEKNQLLFIFRNGRWDLPKGKMEKGETFELTAIREVEEECGIKISSLKKHLITTYHTYEINRNTVLKVNYWFLMNADSHQMLQPQTTEGIDKVEWKNLNEVSELLSNSYDSIKDVIAIYHKEINK